MNLFENPDDAACFRFSQLLGVEPSIMTLYLITCQPRGSLAPNWFKNQSEAEPSIMTPIPSRCQHPFDNFLSILFASLSCPYKHPVITSQGSVPQALTHLSQRSDKHR